MSSPQPISSSYKNILVLADSSPSYPGRLKGAAHLAKAHGAHVMGLFVRSLPNIPPFVLAQLGEEVLEAHRTHAREAAKTAENLFAETFAGLDCDWTTVDGSLQDKTLLFARRYDVVVASTCDAEADLSEEHADVLEHLVLFSGRPLLILPHAAPNPTFGRRALIAWNGTREGARTIHDSLPLLTRAETVEIVSFLPKSAPFGSAAEKKEDLAALTDILLRHGIAATPSVLSSSESEIGVAIQNRAAETKTDTLIVGAYGRSRLMELILGGTTRYILRHAKIPLLTSH